MDHVLVAGAGIVGISAAIWLQRGGYKVTLLDREGPAAGASHGNAGVLAAAAMVPVPTPGLMAKVPFMLFGRDQPLFLRYSYVPKLLPFFGSYLRRCNDRDVDIYAKGMAPLIYDTVDQHRALAAGTEAENFIEERDYCHGYRHEADFKADEKGWALRHRMGFHYDVCSGADYERYDPMFAGKFETVVRCKNHGRLTDPRAYIKALADHFVAQGGALEIGEITDIITTGKGRTELVTSQGLMSADHIVLALGAWSKSLVEKLGVRVPMEAERGYHIELINPSAYPVAPMMVVDGKFVVNAMEGRVRCAGTVEFGGLKAPASKAPLDMIKRRVKALLPDVTYESCSEWLGHRPALVDSLPMLGGIQGHPDIYVAFGHQHLGVTGGPKTGRIVAEMLQGQQSNLDPTPYRADRFNRAG